MSARSRQPPRKDPSELESHLGYWLRLVSNEVSNRFRERIDAEGLLVSEWVLLRRMYGAAAVSATDLARAMGMTRGGTSKLLVRLEEKRLLTRAAVDGDGRRQALALTARGAALVPRLAKLADENDEHFFGPLSGRDRDKLLSVMQALARIHHLKSAPVD